MDTTQTVVRPDGSVRVISSGILAVANAAKRLSLHPLSLPSSKLVYQADTDVLYRSIDDRLIGSEYAWLREEVESASYLTENDVGSAAFLDAGSAAGNVPVLDGDGNLVGPIIGRMILDSDMATVPALGEQCTLVDSLTAPTTAAYRLGDGVTPQGISASAVLPQPLGTSDNPTFNSLALLGSFSSDNGAVYTDGIGHLVMGLLTSDAGNLYSDGTGGVSMSNLSILGGLAGIFGDGSVAFDSGAIHSDGFGNLTAAIFLCDSLLENGTGYVGVSPLRLEVHVVADLASLSVPAGTLVVVTNALTPAWNATVVGGGAVTVPVMWDGTNWKVR